MRTLLGLGIFICLFLHFNKKEAAITKTDSLTMIQSSAKEVVPASKTENIAKEQPVVMEVVADKKTTKAEFPEETEVDSEDYGSDDMALIPWAEIEEGWRNHLKDFLISVEPEKGEEIFAAYLGATQKYSQRVDYVEDEDIEMSSNEGSEEDPLSSMDDNGYDPEASHTNTLKEIFGELYPQVEALHQEYVQSIQYLNRSSAEISISL